MKIEQQMLDDKWIVTIKFDGYTFTGGHGPFFLAGNFNDWKVEDEKYKLKRPQHGGANCLIDFNLEFPVLQKSFEFKIWDSYGFTQLANWMEPELENNHYSIYNGYNFVVRNCYNKFNIRVDQKISN